MNPPIAENELKLPTAWTMLAIVLLALPLLVVIFVTGVSIAESSILGPLLIVFTIFALIAWIVSLFGFIIVSPNESRVIQLFGKYVGTVKDVGFFYGNPFYTKTQVSLRVHTFETGQTGSAELKDAAGNVTKAADRRRQPSKVNDKDGTPIEIAAVVVWQVVNTADAVFQVDKYDEFVHIQSEAALRNLASQYPYDSHDDEVHSLRSHTQEVADRLKEELEERLKIAGVHVNEARISYLAYAQEIAAAMLQRQQAAAVIAARQKIVEGAVGMVEHALEMLAEKNVLQLDDERRAQMVSNLLVVLCSHNNPQPVVNTGTIYS